MKIKKAVFGITISGILAMLIMAGCSNGKNGGAGATGTTGATGSLSSSPVITGLDPTTASFNTAITITGENFSANPAVYCDGSPAMLMNSSATQITVTGCGMTNVTALYQAIVTVQSNNLTSNGLNEWIVPSGYISQFPAASLTGPQGMAEDSTTGKLYIADNAGVFAVDNATGWTTKIVPATASCASCTLADPAGITMDNNGNLFVTDSYNKTLVGINPTTGATWYVLGPGNGLLNAPIGVTYSNGDLYVANSGSSTITQINGTTLSAVNLTLSLALPSAPYGITADASGNLYVACQGNNTISKIVVTGTNGAVTNSYVTGLTAPYGVSISGTSILATSNSNQVLSTAGIGGGAASAMCADFSPWETNSNSSIVSDGSGGIFVGDPTDGLIYHVNSACNVSTYAAGFADSYDTGYANGDIYAVNYWFNSNVYGDAILEIRPSDGAMKVLAQIVGGGASVIANPTGNITVGSWGGAVINVSSTGVTSTVFPLGTFGNGAGGLAYDNSGNLFINNCSTAIAKWNGSVLNSSFATGEGCYQLAYNNGYLYISNYGGKNIQTVNASTGGAVTTYVPSSTGIGGSEGLGFDIYGNLISVDDRYNGLFRIDPLGHVKALVPAATSPMKCPNGIGIASSQLIYTDEECGGTSARMWVIAP